MALSGVHQIPIRVVINKDPVASDMTVYNAWIYAVNGILVRAFVGPEGVCAWGAITKSDLVIAKAPVTADTVISAPTTSAAAFVSSAVSSTVASSPSAHSRDLTARGILYCGCPVDHVFYVCRGCIEAALHLRVAQDVGLQTNKVAGFQSIKEFFDLLVFEHTAVCSQRLLVI